MRLPNNLISKLGTDYGHSVDIHFICYTGYHMQQELLDVLGELVKDAI